MKTKILICAIILLLTDKNISAQSTFPVKVDTGGSAMVVAAHPAAAKVGVDILKVGGNAVDAAVAMAFVIGVVEPHASGLGGGGGMLIYSSEDQSYQYLDYYVKSPAVIDTTYSSKQGVATVNALCIPGTPAGLLAASRRFGRLPLSDVIAPALRIAERGIVVNEGLFEAILEKLEVIMTFPGTAELYLIEDLPPAVGDTLKNEGLLTVLLNLAEYGEDYFYRGPFAQQATRDIIYNGGTATFADFSGYEAILRSPAKTDYRDYKIYTSAPPQSGLTLLEILKIVEHVPESCWRPFTVSVCAAHYFIEAIKRADFDRLHYLGDPAYINVPVTGLLDSEYTRIRFSDIDPHQVKYEDNNKIPRLDPFSFEDKDAQHTTHISVVDPEGNAVSLTQTLGLFFGSGFSSQGILFNSSMSVFYTGNVPNAMAPNKRPASTICPTIIAHNDRPVAVLGTPGGGNIFNTMAEVIINLLDFKMSPVEAVDAPRISPRISRTNVNLEDRFDPGIIEQLQARGHTIRLTNAYNLYMGGIQLIYFDESMEYYIGVSDARRDGAAEGL